MIKLSFYRSQRNPQRFQLFLASLIDLPLHSPLAKPHSSEDRLHRIIVPLRDRVELVIVTPRAANRQAKKRCAGSIDHISQFILPLRQSEIRIRTLYDIIGPGHQKPGPKISTHGIPRQMLFHELIVGLVSIKGLDHIITKTPRTRTFPVSLKPVALRKTRDVKPVSRHSLAIMWTGQNAVHQVPPSLRRIVVHEMGYLLRRRREPQHHEIKSPDEITTIGAISSLQVLARKRFIKKGIHIGVAMLLRHRLKGPVIGSESHHLPVTRHLCPLFDPPADARDLFFRKCLLLLRRHGFVRIVTAHKFVEITLVAFSDNKERLTRIPTFPDRGRRIETQFTLLLLLAVTLRAMSFEDGPNVSLKPHFLHSKSHPAKIQRCGHE